MEEKRGYRVPGQKTTNSLRSSPNYIECRCKDIQKIKQNLAAAVETIQTLRDENTKIRSQLKFEYESKLSTLQNECIYLKFKLNLSENSQPTQKLHLHLVKLKKLCRQKDKIIEIQSKKLKEIGNSVKLQTREVKHIIKYAQSLNSSQTLSPSSKDSSVHPRAFKNPQNLQHLSSNLSNPESPTSFSSSPFELASKSISKPTSVNSPTPSSKISKTEPAEDIKIYPHDYSSIFQEGEQLLHLIENQNSRLCKLSKEISDTYQVAPSEISQEFSSGISHCEEEPRSSVETFTKKRSMWNKKPEQEDFSNVNMNLRIPVSDRSLEEKLEKIEKRAVKSSKNGKKTENSSVTDRFAEYMRPNLKKEQNWESVDEFFNSD